MPPSLLPIAILVDGEPMLLRERFDLVQHKPVGVVTAHRDGRHATAFDLLHDAPLYRDLRAVGRLDLDTSGLLLWTTDGTLLHRLTHPRWAVPRRYHVGLAGAWRDPTPDLELGDGHRPRIVELRRLDAPQIHPALRRSPSASHHATITVTTGRFHEVRRIFAALGTEVVDLCRVGFGPLSLPEDLPAGQWRAADLKATFADMHPAAP